MQLKGWQKKDTLYICMTVLKENIAFYILALQLSLNIPFRRLRKVLYCVKMLKISITQR